MTGKEIVDDWLLKTPIGSRDWTVLHAAIDAAITSCAEKDQQIADLQAKLDEAEGENTRLSEEHKQCHEQNSRLVSEHYALRADLAARRAVLRRGWELLRDVDAYQRHPDRGNPDAECACCMGELFGAEDRSVMEAMHTTLAAALEEQP